MMKGKLLQEVWDEFSEEDKAQIEARKNVLIQEYLTWQDLRQSLVQLAKNKCY